MKMLRHRVKIFPFIMLLLAIVYLFPLYLLIVNAFKDYDSFLRSPYNLPPTLHFENIKNAFVRSKFPEAAVNNLMVTFLVVTLLVIFSSMSAYALVRRKGKYLDSIYLYLVAGILIPFQVYMIPLVREFQLIGLGRSLLALILTFVAQSTPMTVFLYTGYIKTIPVEIEEAALIDGCNPFRLFARIIFPVLTPCTATVTILTSLSVWNSYVQPLTIVGNGKWKMLFVQINNLIGSNFFLRWNVVFAACLIASLPMLLVFIILQKRIIGGLTGGAVKG